MTLDVIIIDDRRSFAEALAYVVDAQPDLCCVGTPPDIDAAFEVLEGRHVDVAVLAAGDLGAVRLKSAQLLVDLYRMPVVVLAEDVHPDRLGDTTRTGAAALVSKRSSFGHVLAAIRSAPGRKLLVDGPTVELLLEHASVPHDDDAGPCGPSARFADLLTARELDVLRLLGEGLDPTQIASELIMSVHTSRGHVKSIMSKLGVHSQLQAVVVAAREGLLPELARRR